MSVFRLPAPVAQLNEEEVLARLWQIVKREQVPVLPRDWVMWCTDAARYGQAAVGAYDAETDRIYLRPDHLRNPWVLAHELGHRTLRREGRVRHTEEDADAAGRGLLLTVLSSREEVVALLPVLNIFLPGR